MKKRLYKLRRVIKVIKTLKNNFKNWDDILKRQLQGLSLSKLELNSGLLINVLNANGLRIHNEIFVQNIYESGKVKVNKGNVVLDIGANIGIFSLYAANNGASKVFSFEPDKINYKYLKENINQNGLNPVVKSYNFGLANNSGKRYLQIANIPGGHQMLREGENISSRDEVIMTKTFSEFTIENELNHIDFVKLDCEGAEGEILESLDENHFKMIDKFAVEFHNNRSILNHNQINELLKSHNFKTNLKWDGKGNYGYIFAWK
jgi:FkbM family methyltransferase